MSNKGEIFGTFYSPRETDSQVVEEDSLTRQSRVCIRSSEDLPEVYKR